MAKLVKAKKEKRQSMIPLIPMFMALALVPIIVRYHGYEAMEKVYLYDAAYMAEKAADFLSWWKAAILIAAAVLMLLCILIYGIKEIKARGKWNALWIPLGVYGIMAFLSACFSKWKYFSFHGMDETFESVWVLLAYGVCAVYSFYIVKDEAVLKKVVRIFGVGMSALSLYGLVELFYKNPLSTPVAKFLIYPLSVLENYSGHLEKLDLVMNLKQLFLTFFNSNYVGSYIALALPFTLGIFLATKEKREKIWFGVLGILEVVFLLASEARSGVYGLSVAVIVLVLFYRSWIIKYWKIATIGVACVMGVVLIADGIQDFTMCRRMLNSFKYVSRTAPNLEKIETLEDCLVITYKGNDLQVQYGGYDKEEPFTAFCGEEEIVYTLNEEEIWETEDSRFEQIQFAKTGTEKYDCFDVGIEGRQWQFINQKKQGGYYYMNYHNYPVKMQTAEKAYGNQWYSLFTRRGYIWAKTLPMLKDTIILGTGPDTYNMKFDHNDYVDDIYYFGNIITRPHNMYLQIGVQTGMVSLVAFLVFVGSYLVSSVKTYWKCKESYLTHIGKGITAGILAYLVAGIVNDSMVGVAQLFWLLIGIGFAVNYLVKKQQ